MHFFAPLREDLAKALGSVYMWVGSSQTRRVSSDEGQSRFYDWPPDRPAHGRRERFTPEISYVPGNPTLVCLIQTATVINVAVNQILW